MSEALSSPDLAEAARAGRLAAELAERKLDALLVTNLVNVRYLTGFTGSNALALIAAPDGAARGRQRFLTDFRYDTQSAAQVHDVFEREIVIGELLDAAVATLLEATAAGAGRLGFDDGNLTVAQHAHLREELPSGWQLIPCAGAVERMRTVKDPAEVARVRAASQLADRALLNVLERGLAGRTEHEVALDLEYEMRRLGARGPSFPTIVAAGAHGALPHAEPRPEPIARDVLVTIDWGALHEGYCSDCTRTYATGEGIPEPARAIYELVLEAQAQGLAALRAGPNGRELDAAARAVIEEAGHGEHFGHGLGHGVGLEIHEAPRLSRTAGDDPILAGSLVTIEPGVYIPSQCGVRIEELALVTADGSEVLTELPAELTVVA